MGAPTLQQLYWYMATGSLGPPLSRIPVIAKVACVWRWDFSRTADMGAPTVQQLYWYDNRKFGSTPLSHSRLCKGGLCVAMGFFEDCRYGGSYTTTAVLV